MFSHLFSVVACLLALVLEVVVDWIAATLSLVAVLLAMSSR